jgi:hypothetical protein
LTSSEVETCLKANEALVTRNDPPGSGLRFHFRPHADEGISQQGYVSVEKTVRRAEQLRKSHRKEWERIFGPDADSAFFAHNNALVAFDDVPSDRVRGIVRSCTA